MSTSQSVARPRPEVQEMVVIHRGFRRAFAAAPALVRALDSGDTARIELVTEHLNDLLQNLEVHHRSEDEYLWPLLTARVTPHAEVIERMEEQHHRIEALIGQAAAAIPALGTNPDGASRERTAGLLEELGTVLSAHMDDEERSILPLVAEHLTVPEWEELGNRGLAKVDKKKLLATLSALLAVATPQEQQIFLSKVPAPARLLWRLAGRRAHRRAEARLYGPEVPETAY